MWEDAVRARRGGAWTPPSKSLRFAIAEPNNFDPGKMADDMSTFIARQLFDGLVTLDTDYNVLPAASERWEILDEGRRYIFHLREGQFWSDGRPLTATDFEYAWKRNLLLAEESPGVPSLYVIKNAKEFSERTSVDHGSVGIRAIDDLTLEVRLESPIAYLTHLLAQPVAYPLPRWVVEGENQPWTDPENIVSNGAYRLIEWEPGDHITLEWNHNYLGSFSGNINRVNCPVIVDFSPVLDSFKKGDIDAVSMVTADPATVKKARRQFDHELVFTPQASTFFLTFCVELPPFDNALVRQAFAHAVDREALVEETTQGLYRSGTSGFIPPGFPGNNPKMGIAFDPGEGKRLLALSNYGKKDDFPEVELVYTEGSAQDPIVPFLIRSWRENLGVHVSPSALNWEEFTHRRENNPAQISMMGWHPDFPDPDSMLRVLFHSTDGFNLPRWHNEQFDHLVENAARVTDPGERIELYKEADRILIVDETVVIPLGYAQGRMLVKPWLNVPKAAPRLLQFKDMVLGEEDL
jgi:oligopeptide transport system substrate-binding protein